MSKLLFEPIVDESKLHPSFVTLRDSPPGHPGRSMMEEVFSGFVDPDGHFLQQFQTEGFDARLFELYLFATLSREGYELDRSHESPDFIVQCDGQRVAIEATTVNKAVSGALAAAGKTIEELSGDELREYERHELAIRFGSPLFSKLRKKYWQLPHCEGLPLVIAIEAFHDPHSLAFSDNALTSYLYGLEQAGEWTASGKLKIETTSVDAHTIDGKTIPSNFFGQPDTENISAILFTNSGSAAKFSRMGFQHGYGNDSFKLIRQGTSFNPHREVMDPTWFCYDVGQPPLIEHWSQGLVVCHNPNAVMPLSKEFFDGAVQAYVEDGVHVSEHTYWHPISSKTHTVHLGDIKSRLPLQLLSQSTIEVRAIGKADFQSTVGNPDVANPLFDEHGWFADSTDSFMGVLILDKADKDWGYVILARDPHFAFRAIETAASFASRIEARQRLQFRIGQLVQDPKRIFVQD